VLSVADRYLLAEITKVFSAIILTLLMVMVSMLLLRTLEDINIGALASDAMLRYLGLQILRDIASLLPPAFFIAALVTLGRLAIDKKWQGKGIGSGLLKDAVKRTLRASENIGIRGLVVHAIDDRAMDFYRKLGFRPSPTNPYDLLISIEEALKVLS